MGREGRWSGEGGGVSRGVWWAGEGGGERSGVERGGKWSG